MGRAQIALAAMALLWCGPAWAAAAVPLPVPRPAGAGGAAGVGSAPNPSEPSACLRRLSEVAVWSPPPPLTGGADCGSEDMLQLNAVIMPDRSRVAMEPPAVLRCSMAAEVTRWVRDDVGPAALRLGAPLAAVNNAASYTCRGRNGQRGGKISEHGRANALDVASIRLTNRTVAALTDPAVSRPFREAMRVSACGRFSTVLGPGSDGFHEHHVHVDLIERSRGMRMCQWDIRDPASPASVAAAEPAAKQAAASEPAARTAAPAATAVEVAHVAPAAAAVAVEVPLPLPRPVALVAGESTARAVKPAAARKTRAAPSRRPAPFPFFRPFS